MQKKYLTIAITAIALGLIIGVALGMRIYAQPSSAPAPAPKVASAIGTEPRSVTPVSQPTVKDSVLTPDNTKSGKNPAPTPNAETSQEPNWEATSLPEVSPEAATLPKPEMDTQYKPVKLASNAPVVCIDPGHPSETSAGAHAHGLSENRLNWDVALKLRSKLEAKGIRCILTKNSLNQNVTNRERAEIANRANAKVMVRLHCDVGGGHGYTWYYPDRAGHKYGVTGPPKSVQQASRRAAQVINENMKPVLQGHLRSNAIKTDASTFVGGKQGGVLTGSIFARVPTALIEMCYINQKKDAQFIASQNGQNLMAEALARGIAAYVE